MGQFKFSLNEGEYQAVMRKLGQLAEVDQQPVIRKAMKTGGKVLITAGRASFKARNRKKTGDLYRSLTSNLKKKKHMGILIGFRRGVGGGNHAHLIDRGTVDRYTKKGYYRGRIDGQENGKTGATYFWTNVVETKGDEALDRIIDAVYDAVDKIKSTR